MPSTAPTGWPRHKPDLIAAEFALNEGGGGRYDQNGKAMGIGVQVGEKTVQNFKLETTNPGGHSIGAAPRQRDYRSGARHGGGQHL